MTPRYPDVTVRLTSEDGNAFAVLAAVTRALREAGVKEEERMIFFNQATAGNYDNLLQTCMKWVAVR